MKRVFLGIVSLALCFGVVIFLKALIDSNRTSKQNHLLYAIPKQIQYSITLQNSTVQPIKAAEFWTYAPVRQTAVQYCDRIESLHPYELISDDVGNQILHFTFNNLPPHATKIITIKADPLFAEKEHPVTVAASSAYIRPEKYIESDNPVISHLARNLKTSGTIATAEKIFS